MNFICTVDVKDNTKYELWATEEEGNVSISEELINKIIKCIEYRDYLFPEYIKIYKGEEVFRLSFIKESFYGMCQIEGIMSKKHYSYEYYVKERYYLSQYRKKADLPKFLLEGLEKEINDSFNVLLQEKNIEVNNRYHQTYKRDGVRFYGYKKDFKETLLNKGWKKYSVFDDVIEYRKEVNGNIFVIEYQDYRAYGGKGGEIIRAPFNKQENKILKQIFNFYYSENNRWENMLLDSDL